MSAADHGQTSRTISGVHRVREAAPSRTPSPSVGSFQDMAATRPRQDDFVMQKVTPPSQALPHPHRMPPPPTRDKVVPQVQVPVVQYDSVIPETEADASDDDVLFRERRTKSEKRCAMGKEAEVRGCGSQWVLEEKKRATNALNRRGGRCTSTCKRVMHLKNGSRMGTVPGVVLNQRLLLILVEALLSSLPMIATKVRTQRMISKTCHQCPN